MMRKLLAALLFSTPLAVALPAAAKFQAYGASTLAAEKSDEDKDKSKGDEEKKGFKVSIDENDYDKLDRPAADGAKKEFKDARANCEAAAKDKKLTGAAQRSFMKKCVKDAGGA